MLLPGSIAASITRVLAGHRREFVQLDSAAVRRMWSRPISALSDSHPDSFPADGAVAKLRFTPKDPER